MSSVYSRDALQSRLPSLLVAPHKTASFTTRRVYYSGPIAPWTDFRKDVLRSILTSRWIVVDLTLKSRDIKLEQVYVADETGVQGRFQQAVGQVLGTVVEGQLQAGGPAFRFGDFMSAGRPYEKTPDVAIVSRGTSVELKAVGEIKVPWVKAHDLSMQYQDIRSLRTTLGQVVEYMVDLKVPYGFHSTYDETIFLRHVELAGGSWRLEYSTVINNYTTDIPVKQCFWHLAKLAAAAQPVDNPRRKTDLIKQS